MKLNERQIRFRHLMLMIALPILLTACGGGGESKPATVLQGTFVDDIVEGLRFDTPTQSGLTDNQGTFRYINGETVDFHVGDIYLGSATGADILTPIDLVPGAVDETDPQVTNILRFVQSLEKNAYFLDGIQISTEIDAAFTGKTLDFSLPATDFENAFAALSAAVPGGLTLVSAADAQQQMRTTLVALGLVSPASARFGSLTISGADIANIGASFTPGYGTSSETSLSWGNENATQHDDGAAHRLVANLNTSGQLSSVDYYTDDYSAYPPRTYSYQILCSGTAGAYCSAINLDTAGKRLEFNNAELDVSPNSVDNLETGPVTLTGTLYWE